MSAADRLAISPDLSLDELRTLRNTVNARIEELEAQAWVEAVGSLEATLEVLKGTLELSQVIRDRRASTRTQRCPKCHMVGCDGSKARCLCEALV